MKPGDAGPPWVGAKGSPVLAEIFLLLAVFFVGMDVVSVKYALEGLPPLVFMPFRYVLAGLLLLAALRLVGRKVARSSRETSPPWRASGWWVSPSTMWATRRA